ncbi:MAG: acyltransferase [Rhodobacter sp.]|nr:acyltransferase [Rhodobacter sp.]
MLTEAHTGLRGLLTGWIVLFHAVIFSVGWNLHGSALMPVFYLLAGYSLALTYGGGVAPRRFYRNRVARIAPVYYVAMLIALPLAVAGRSWVPPEWIPWTLATNLFAVQMWISWVPVSFVGPAWTISTLAFFYVLFPWLLRWHERQSDAVLRRWLIGLFCAQFAIYFGISFAVGPYNESQAFWAAHAWPVSRLPVFEMALVAGILVRRGAWPVMGLQPDRAGRRVDRAAAAFAACILAFSALDMAGTDALAAWWMQAVFPWTLLMVIAGLSAPGAHPSLAHRLFTWPPLVFLGRIGLPLYLIHEVVIYATAWATAPDRPFYFAAMPAWTIAVVLPASLAAALALHHLVERPARARLRAAT